jgi:hypothetical protein
MIKGGRWLPSPLSLAGDVDAAHHSAVGADDASGVVVNIRSPADWRGLSDRCLTACQRAGATRRPPGDLILQQRARLFSQRVRRNGRDAVALIITDSA